MGKLQSDAFAQHGVQDSQPSLKTWLQSNVPLVQVATTHVDPRHSTPVTLADMLAVQTVPHEPQL